MTGARDDDDALWIGSARQRIPSQIRRVVQPIVEDLGCTLVGVEFRPEGGRNVLWVYIDIDGGVDIDDCARVSTEISAAIDVEDPIPQMYDLRVSSPGVERPLMAVRDFARYAGETAIVQLSESLDGRRKFTGELLAVSDAGVQMRCSDVTYVLPLEAIRRAHLKVDFTPSSRKA